MLSELVKTYPNIDFHRESQKLAVGTFEGACIMYDLKTATRLYVLHLTPGSKGSQNSCTAVSFSPDGRRLVTLALEDRVVGVWKVGVSLLGLLTPGRPPRQHGTSSTNDEGPYKVIEFSLASDGE